MQFDEFDKKAKEAADHHHPAYDEQAWAKMEKMLNKHLPQKEDDRRKFIFFILLFLGLGGAGLFIVKAWNGKKAIAQTEQSVQHRQLAAPPLSAGKEKSGNSNHIIGNTDEVNPPVGNDYSRPVFNPSAVKQTTDQRINNIAKNSSVSNPIGSPSQKSKEINNTSAVNSDNNKRQHKDSNVISTDKDITKQEPEKTSNMEADAVIIIGENNDEPVPINKVQVLSVDKPTMEEEEKMMGMEAENQPKSLDKASTAKGNNKKSRTFFFTLSTGPDVSSVGNNKLGSTELLFGAGLGYTFNNRVVIRAGFYTGRKVYTASADAYHPPAIFYTYYPNFEKVEADCQVYEIPLSISYNFRHTTKENWFAAAGVSSYLMKKETYNYFYKNTPTGPTVTRKRSIANENKHYFSALTLSGGYQRNISKSISLMIEPYVKLPLTGIGYGKVKLNSGGILFSIGIKPFAAKKGKPGTSH